MYDIPFIYILYRLFSNKFYLLFDFVPYLFSDVTFLFPDDLTVPLFFLFPFVVLSFLFNLLILPLPLSPFFLFPEFFPEFCPVLELLPFLAFFFSHASSRHFSFLGLIRHFSSKPIRSSLPAFISASFTRS